MECIYFVTNQPNHMTDPIKIVDFKPPRDRQKLLREQGVLDQVILIFFVRYVQMSNAFLGWHFQIICYKKFGISFCDMLIIHS